MNKVKYIAMISVTLFVFFTFQGVTAENMPPESSIISYSAGQFKNTDLFIANSSSQDTDGYITNHEWYSSIDGYLAFTEHLEITNLSTGNHLIYYRCQDNSSLWSDFSSINVTVVENLKPEAIIVSIIPENQRLEPLIARYDEYIEFEGSGKDSDGIIINYQWEYSQTLLFSNFTNLSYSQNFNTTISESGGIYIRLKVQDNDEEWSSWNTTLIFIEQNEPPISSITKSEFEKLEEGHEINLVGIGEDESGNNLESYEWRARVLDTYKIVQTNDYIFNSAGDFTESNSTSNLFIENEFEIDNFITFEFRVKDSEGLWSDWSSKTIYVDDGDGVDHFSDEFPLDSTQWTDSDNDGYGDNPYGNLADVFPNDKYEWKDTDGDGIGDNGDVLVTINNYHAANGGIFFVAVLTVLLLEIWYRNTTERDLNLLNVMIDNGAQNSQISEAKKNIDKVGGVVLVSREAKRANILTKEIIKINNEMFSVFKKIKKMEDSVEELKGEGVGVEKFVKEISDSKKKLEKQAIKDFGKKYIEWIKEEKLKDGANL